MNSLEQMREAVESVVDAYSVRIDAVSTLLAESYAEMDSVRLEWRRISEELQEVLASKASLRRSDFNRIMGDIITRREQRELEVKTAFSKALENQKRFAALLKASIASSDLGRVRAINEQIESEMKKIKKVLEDFHREQTMLTRKLKALLENRDSLTVPEFRSAITQINRDIHVMDPEAPRFDRAV